MNYNQSNRLTLVVDFDSEDELLQAARALTEVANARGRVSSKQLISDTYYYLQEGKSVPGENTTGPVGASDPSEPAEATGAPATRTRRRRPTAATNVAAAAPSAADTPKSNGPAASVDTEISYGGDAEEALAFDGDDTADATPATWAEVVEVLNALHSKGFDKAKKVLADCGVLRAADLKAEDQGVKRGQVFRAAKAALS